MDPKNISTIGFQGKKYSCEYIIDWNRASICIEYLLKKDVLFSVDVETAALTQYKHIPTAALSPHLSRVRLFQLFDGDKVYIFDCDKIERSIAFKRLPSELFTHLLSTKRFVAHNATFELQRFMQWGVKHCNIACTLITGKLVCQAIYPTDAGLRYDLGSLTDRMLKTEVLKIHGASDWGEPDLTFEQIQYAGLDTLYCYAVAKKLANALPKLGLERIYKLMKDVQHPVAAMQLNGIGFDTEKHLAAIPYWKDSLYEAKLKAMEVTGLKSITPMKISDWLSKNLDKTTKAIWPRTPTKKLATDAHAFSDFDYLPIVKPFSTYQKKKTLCSGFGNKLIQLVNPGTKRLHGSLKICGARTGRFSCSSPNLQNMPRSPSYKDKKAGEPDIRDHFIAGKGKVLICADFSMIELRVAAELSQDKEMLKCFKNGIDLHCLTASIVSGIPVDKIGKKSPERQNGKALNFGLLFGLGPKKYAHYAKKSYGVDISEEKAFSDIEKWHQLYSGYTDWQQAQADRAAETKTCRTPCGKLRKLPKDSTYGNSMNHPVQGGAAEVMMYSLVKLYERLPKRARLVNTVHDEVIVEVRNKKFHVDWAKEVIEECMTEGFLEVFPNGITRGLVEAKAGKTWAEAK